MGAVRRESIDLHVNMLELYLWNTWGGGGGGGGEHGPLGGKHTLVSPPPPQI